MKGSGEARAAISVVNALPLGVGAAIGIDWPARATAYLEPGRPPRARAAVEPSSSGTPLVHAAASAALQRFGGAGVGRLRLVVRSTIPAERGLKSSTAVSSSVALATARASGKDPSPREVARLVAETGRATGTSATGAFDDALAGVVAGGVVTDNRHDLELRRFDVDRTLAVALWVPERRHPSSPSVQGRFRREASLARRAADAAQDGDWVRAMAANSALVEKVMGYRYANLHERAKREGAVASGVSGLGPAFAIVAPSPRLPRLLRGLPREGRRRSVRLFLEPGSGRSGSP